MDKLPVERLEKLNLEHLRLRAEKALSTQGISISRWMMWKEIKRLIDAETAQQSVTDADVLAAIKYYRRTNENLNNMIQNDYPELIPKKMEVEMNAVAITALEQYRKPEPCVWIELDDVEDCCGTEYECSKCGSHMLGKPNYCENCGVKLEPPKAGE